ncbi:UPF0481 protein At3g47200 [Rosa chinensis]|nr:UPF0481 protein At3g47200 [Rosa chinensis]XP_040369367.1 UPF0481 protein At3g47200 [Rosa chinensis]
MEDHCCRIIDVEALEQIDVEALEQCMKAELRSDSPLSATCCIFRVPEVLRRRKPEAYAPDVVSIGPFHHRSSKLFATMKDVKQWYLNSLLLRNNVSLKALIQGIDNITGFEKRARDYYAESIDHLNRYQFIEMMIIDGCFLLELFQRNDDSVPITNCKRNDPLSNMSCMVQYLCHDLMLLENQLPWFVLESLYGLTCDKQVPLTTLVLKFFNRLSSLYAYCNDYSIYTHDDETLHILDLIRSAIVVPFKRFESIKCDSAQLPHATALLESAGIEFKRSFAAGLMSIDFKDGVLKIPQLEIAEMTEPLFRNLIAFEQCYHGRQHMITSYALLMDKLIASSEDVVLLCDRGIIQNWLGAEDVSQLFSTLYSDTLVTGFCYGGLCAEVNEYYKGRWNQWLARLKHDYLSDPWKIISLVAAVILLVLTLLQTMYTIQQYHSPPK